MPRRMTVGLSLVLASTVSAAGQAQAPVDWESVRQAETRREAYQRVADIFEAMRVQPGIVVADLGAGDGFLTSRLAQAVGSQGRVLAVDIDRRALDRLRARVEEERLTNVTIVRGDEDDPHVPAASLDAVVIVNSYHEMRAHQAILYHVRRALKPDGRLVIVEPLSERRRHESREILTRAHELALPFVEDDVRQAGFRVARTEDPFSTRGPDIMSLLVAVPDPDGWSDTADSSKVDARAASSGTSLRRDDELDLLSNPDLRMPAARFKQLRDSGGIIVLDVRTETEFRSAHIRGAISIPLDRISDELERLRRFDKPVVAYCG
jgi:SAM-dependent methyltransferase